MPSRKQPYLSSAFIPRSEHGGSIRKGRRKLERPLDPKRPLHVVMRSEKARGRLFLLHPGNSKTVALLIHRYAKRFRVRVYEYANAGNHIHLLVKGSTRRDLQNFLRKLAGAIAQAVTGAKKGKPFGRFWDELIYSRVIEWGRAFSRAMDYVTLNSVEAAGISIPGLRKRKSLSRAGPQAKRETP